MRIILDVETSGLPGKRYAHYKDLKAYDTSRIVSISWIITTTRNRVVAKHYEVVKPDGFCISRESALIHGISQREAIRTGSPFKEVVKKIRRSLEAYPCDTFVAHNVYFDFNILLSELYRLGDHALIGQLFKMNRYCTMMNGKKQLELAKFPKLVELYETLMSVPMENAHNALADAEGCYECFKILYQRNQA